MKSIMIGGMRDVNNTDRLVARYSRICIVMGNRNKNRNRNGNMKNLELQGVSSNSR